MSTLQIVMISIAAPILIWCGLYLIFYIKDYLSRKRTASRFPLITPEEQIYLEKLRARYRMPRPKGNDETY